MNDYWLLVPTVATSLIAVAFALLWRHEVSERAFDRHFADVDNSHLLALLADRDEGIAERDAEIKALRMQTVETPSMTIPARPKRTAKKKLEEAS